MPQSISSRQRQLLESKFLDLSGSSRLEYGPVSLDTLSDQLAVWAIEFAQLARQHLQQADRTASGYLEDSIIPTEVSIFGKVYQIGIKVADYYKYVDQGVKGWADEKGGNSPYQFRQFTGQAGTGRSQMVDAIRKWLIREGLKGRGKENAHPKASRRDRARASITDSSTQTAIIISRAIRKKGLRPSHFWSDTVAAMTPKLKDQLGKALKIDIISNLIPQK